MAGVGSRRLECLPPALHAPLFCGSVPPRPQASRSSLTQSDQDFLGLAKNPIVVIFQCSLYINESYSRKLHYSETCFERP